MRCFKFAGVTVLRLMLVRNHILALLMMVALVFPLGIAQAGINDDLEAIDAVIRLDPTPIRIVNQDAFNIYQGATDALLEQKRLLLQAAGLNQFASLGYYKNFYSFTSEPLYTDTKIAVTTLTSSLRLYRRGSSANQEASSYLRPWWGGKYRGQKQKWFLFRFNGQDSDVKIATEHPEFAQWRWILADEMLDLLKRDG